MAKLTPAGRRLLVERVLGEGWSPTVAAEAMGVSRKTAYRWLARYRAEGIAGLEDRSCRPHESPTRTAPEIEAEVCRLRREHRWGPHRISYATGVARSTVYRILCRYGLNRLSHFDRPTRMQIRRYERDTPGELLHVDVKKLGRIPDGGGWRAHGKGNDPTRGWARVGWDYLHVAVDDHSRVAYLEVHRDEKAVTCAQFLANAAGWFADHGVTIQRIMTDNALAYTRSHIVADTLTNLGIRHLTTRRWRPQTNGKVERFHQTLINEWAYARTYFNNQSRLNALPPWIDSYNHHRPHTALGGQPPASRVTKLMKKHS